MNKKIAGMLFLGVCTVLAVLLVTGTINSITSGIIFAAALVLFGILSKGFKSSNEAHKNFQSKNNY